MTGRKVTARCTAEGCTRQQFRKHPYCRKHYQMATAGPCEVEGCHNSGICAGRCEAHYQRRRRGSPKSDMPEPAAIVGEDVTAVTTRIRSDLLGVIRDSLKPGEEIYGRARTILEEYAKGLRDANRAA